MSFTARVQGRDIEISINKLANHDFVEIAIKQTTIR